MSEIKTFNVEKDFEKHIPVRLRSWYLANALDSASKAGVDQFLPIFAINLGASTSQIGLLSGLFSLVNVFQIIWANLSLKIHKTKIFVVIGWFFSAIFFIPMAFLKQGQILLLLLYRFLQGVFSSATGPTQASLMAEHIPLKKRASGVTRFTQISLIGTLIGALFGGFLYSFLSDILEFDPNISFLILFFWTAFLGISTSFIFHLSVPDPVQFSDTIDPIIFVEQNLTVNAKASSLGLPEKIKIYYSKFHNFWTFTLYGAFFYFAINISSPFFIILEIQYYNFSFFQASILTSLTTLIQFMISMILVKFKILDYFGRKFPLSIGMTLLALSTFLVTIPYYFPIPAFIWSFFAWIILGTGWGIFNSALAVMILDLVHPQYRATLIAVYNTLVGLMMFIGPIIGGMIVELIADLASIFLLRSVLIICTFGLFQRVKEPELPGMITHPMKYISTKIFRVPAEGGAQIIVSPIRSIRARFPHWTSARRHIKLER